MPEREFGHNPGGPRPKDQVHSVGPDEAISINEEGKLIVGSRQGTSPESENLVLTPGGFRHPSLVHKVEPGHALRMTGDRLQMISQSEEVVADFGMILQRKGDVPLMPGNVFLLPKIMPAMGSGWISYAYWTNNTGKPVTSFATTWVVPPAPASQSGQTIFLFNGIQNSTMIYQPVLQWGPSAAGGGNYWAVASWYADGQGGVAFHSPLVQVNPGDVLVGIMTLSGQSQNGFSYNCQFQGIAQTSLPIQNQQQLTWCIETLEAYGVTKCSDYPATGCTAFSSINMQTGTVNPALTWTSVNGVTDCGQHCVVVSNANPGGEVDICYKIVPTWYNNKQVIMTYAVCSTQWAWAYISDVPGGWRQIKTDAPDGVTNVFVLCCNARAKGRSVNVYADDKYIYQMYML